MPDFLQSVFDWVTYNPGWAGTIIFLAAFGESMAVIGLIVPGVVIMFAIGTLIATGVIDFWFAMACSVTGAIAGDGLSFWIGHYYKHQIPNIWPFRKHPDMLERGVGFFQRYGGKSILFGRFFGPVRAVVPLVAGMMHMPTGRFLFANVASALLWAPAYLLPGLVFGASMELASQVAIRLVIVLLVVVILLWLMLWISEHLFRLIRLHANTNLLVVLLLSLSLLAAINITQTVDTKHSFTYSEWHDSDWPGLPINRDELIKAQKQPMALLWVADRDDIENQLTRLGWTKSDKIRLRSVLAYLNPNNDVKDLQVLPHVHAGRYDSIRFSQPTGKPDQQRVLRLWPAPVTFSDDARILWMGTVAYQRRDSFLSLLNYRETNDDFLTPLKDLAEQLTNDGVETERKTDRVLVATHPSVE